MSKQKTAFLIPDELNRIDFLVVKKSDFSYLQGLLNGILYSVPDPYGDALTDALELMDAMKKGVVNNG